MKKQVTERERQCIGFGLMILASTILLAGLAGCGDNKEPIKIGFAGTLTGRLSDLGMSSLHAVTLAVDEVNDKGGVNGRPVELIVKDDQQDLDVAVKVDKELIDEGVAAIIGHITSALTAAAVPLMNKEKKLMISPSASTNKLTGLDDYLLRITAPSRVHGEHLVGYLYREMGLRNVSVVYDLSNRAFAEGLFRIFKSEFERMGGAVVHTETFSSGREVAYLNMARNILHSAPGGLLIITGALDAAMICQQLKKLGSTLPIVSSGWAGTSDLLQKGGRAVEGIIISQPVDINCERKEYLEFKKKLNERFGIYPDFAAIYSYEAARMLFHALAETDDAAELRDVILKKGVFDGLQKTIRMDKYGDTRGRRFIVTVKDGRFKTLR